MQDLKALNQTIKELTTLRTMANVYGEVAATRMNQIRHTVLFSRTFIKNIHRIFATVQKTYAHEVKALGKKRSSRKDLISFLPHNGKDVAVFISANTRLYGNLITRTYQAFLSDSKENNYDSVVIGRIGKSLLQKDASQKFRYFDFPDDKIDPQALTQIFEHLIQYERIHLYYGHFKNIMTQDPTKLTLTANIEDLAATDAPPTKYIFEPSLEAILKYFETEIFQTILEQSLNESQLAKHAARLVAMDRAEQNIKKRLKHIQNQKLKAVHRQKNREQLNMLASTFSRFQ